MTVRIRSGGDPETTTCRWCEQVSTCHYVGRMFCPSYKECSRLYNYSIKSMFDIRKKDRLFVSYSICTLKRNNNKYEANVMMFREYIWYHVRPDLEKSSSWFLPVFSLCYYLPHALKCPYLFFWILRILNLDWRRKFSWQWF